MTIGKIHIKKLKLNSILGAYPEERTVFRPIVLDAELSVDISECCVTDSLSDAVDYELLSQELRAFTESSSFCLIEKLAFELASLCLGFSSRVLAVSLTVTKPGCPDGAEAAAVSVTLEKTAEHKENNVSC